MKINADRQLHENYQQKQIRRNGAEMSVGSMSCH